MEGGGITPNRSANALNNIKGILDELNAEEYIELRENLKKEILTPKEARILSSIVIPKDMKYNRETLDLNHIAN